MKQRKCAVCGKNFEPKSARHKYCSKRCKFGEGKCIQCGKTFVKKGNTTGDYCSSACWYEWHKKQNDRECVVCGQVYHPNHSQQKTCSYKCADELRRVDRNTHCEQCGKKLASDIHPKVRFCSKSCAMKGRIIKGVGVAPIGKRTSHSSGYVNLKVGKDHPSANGRGWMLEHRYIMQQQLGRLLESHERVHHKNGVRNDNRPENLELWTVGKKDPAGQRQVDMIKNMINKLPQEDRRAIYEWLRDRTE